MEKRRLKKRDLLILFFFIAATCFGGGMLVSSASGFGALPLQQKAEKDESNLKGQEIIETGEEKINLNTADYYELLTLEGIGDKTARSIVDFRQEHGGFNDLEELVILGLISSQVADKIADQIVVKLP